MSISHIAEDENLELRVEARSRAATLVGMLELAGVPVGRRTVLKLATMLRRDDHHHAADTLQGAIATSQTEVSLTPRERQAIVAVLDDPPKDLARLRAALVGEGS